MNLTLKTCSLKREVASREGSRNPRRRMEPFQSSNAFREDLPVDRKGESEGKLR